MFQLKINSSFLHFRPVIAHYPCNFSSLCTAAAAAAVAPLVMESVVDPPPAPTATEEDGNAPKSVSSKNPRIPSQPTNIDSLPDELLSEILVRNSADDIHQRARFVCKRWHRTIHRRAFVTAHLNRSGYGLLLPRSDGYGSAFFAATQGGGIEVSELSCELKSSIMSSCNGLILASRLSEGVDPYAEITNHALYVENPTTKCCLDLPMFYGERGYCNFGIAYAAASDEYKVFATCSDKEMLAKCSILTVGVDDAWRHVETHQLSRKANLLLLRDLPLITEGFMYWFFSRGMNFVLTMNVETEVFSETRAPLAPVKYRVNEIEYAYLSTGRHLSLLYSCGQLTWEVWELNGEIGEWRKLLPNIDCKSKIQQFGWGDDVYLIPTGWVKYPEILFFFTSHIFMTGYGCSCLIYNLVKDEMESVELPYPVDIIASVHKKSMVCLK